VTSHQLVRVEVSGHRGELILDRPQQKNALTGPLVQQLLLGLNRLIAEDNCHVIVIRGEGGAFCAGVDVKAFFAEEKPAWVASFADDWLAFHAALYCCPKPVVGALQRFAIAGGSALAFSCDFLVVGKSAFIHVAEVELGMAAPINVAWLALKHSMAKALQWVVLGERHYGEELVQLGLASRCVEDHEVLDQARAMADRLAGFKPAAVQGLKCAVAAGYALDREPAAFSALVARIKAAQA
jgi:enoyl-CoA hydratase/carnithine racemase